MSMTGFYAILGDSLYEVCYENFVSKEGGSGQLSMQSLAPEGRHGRYAVSDRASGVMCNVHCLNRGLTRI